MAHASYQKTIFKHCAIASKSALPYFLIAQTDKLKAKANNIEVVWEDPAAEVIHSLRKIETKFGIVSKRISKFNLRIIQILYGLLNPSYLVYLYKRKNNDVLSRCKSLANTICKRGIAAQTIILSRSSGGRVSSLIADQLGIKHVVCLGYPFKHPDHGDEPERYAHLAQLKTPMLIIQGVERVTGLNKKT